MNRKFLFYAYLVQLLLFLNLNCCYWLFIWFLIFLYHFYKWKLVRFLNQVIEFFFLSFQRRVDEDAFLLFQILIEIFIYYSCNWMNDICDQQKFNNIESFLAHFGVLFWIQIKMKRKTRIQKLVKDPLDSLQLDRIVIEEIKFFVCQISYFV